MTLQERYDDLCKRVVGALDLFDAEASVEVPDPISDGIDTIRTALDEHLGRVVYKVEHLFAYGWDDAGWTEDDRPLRFVSRYVAEVAIAEFVNDSVEACERGDLDTAYRKEEYRAVRVRETKQQTEQTP